MATVLSSNLQTEEAVTVVTLAGADDAVFDLNRKGTMFIDNQTGGALVINIVGAGATSKSCPGVGDADLTGGLDVSVADGELYKIPLNPKYQAWLGDGNLTITGGTGAEAYIITL